MPLSLSLSLSLYLSIYLSIHSEDQHGDFCLEQAIPHVNRVLLRNNAASPLRCRYVYFTFYAAIRYLRHKFINIANEAVSISGHK